MIAQNPMIENILATCGATMWMMLPIPQIIKSYREESTTGLSPHLMTLWCSSSFFFAVYGIVEQLSIPLILEPHVFSVLGLISWGQCMYYSRQCAFWKVVGWIVAFFALFGFLEVTSIFTLLYAKEHGTTVPLQVYGYLNTALIAIGFGPQYWEVYKLKEVKGISLLSLVCDMLGGLLCSASLFFRPELSGAALSMYIVVILLDLGIIALSFLLNPAAKRRHSVELPAKLSLSVSGISRLGSFNFEVPEDLEKSPPLPQTPADTLHVPVLDYFGSAETLSSQIWEVAERKLGEQIAAGSRRSSGPVIINLHQST